MIKIVREVIKRVWVPIAIVGTVIPLMLIVFNTLTGSVLEQIDMDKIPDEMKRSFENTSSIMYFLPVLFGVVILVHFLLRSNIGRLVKTANIEKRMEKLKKMGTDQFIKATEAKLLDKSERGNYLYSSNKIIKERELKFLIYSDKSTDRKYISFVDDKHILADEAMASKFSLGENEYARLKVENEA